MRRSWSIVLRLALVLCFLAWCEWVLDEDRSARQPLAPQPTAEPTLPAPEELARPTPGGAREPVPAQNPSSMETLLGAPGTLSPPSASLPADAGAPPNGGEMD